MITSRLLASPGALRVLERHAWSGLRLWPLFLSGLVEPAVYLLSLGIGFGHLVGSMPGPGGRTLSYAEFLAPAMVAVSAMNTAVFNSTFVFFHRLRYARVFDAMLATPIEPRDVLLGELAWTTATGTCYGAVLVTAMSTAGLLPWPWAVLAVPAAALTAFAFAGAGLGLATFMRSYLDFEYVHVIVAPMFLFAATFAPLERYPAILGWAARCTPLYHAVTLQRALANGELGPGLLGNAAVLVVLGCAGTALAHRRLTGIMRA